MTNNAPQGCGIKPSEFWQLVAKTRPLFAKAWMPEQKSANAEIDV